MKKAIIFLTGLLLMNYSVLCGGNSSMKSPASSSDSIKVLCSPDLFNLSVKWTEEYKKSFSEMKIKIINLKDTKIAGNLVGKGCIAFVSNDYSAGFETKSVQKIVIGRDVIVPVINSKNPYLNDLFQHGISPETFNLFFENSASQKWGTLLKNSETTRAHYFWINDESITKGLSGFLKTNINNPGGTEVRNGEELISAIQKDPLAIGFCKLVNIQNFSTRKIRENLSLLPIDKNNNGLIDYNEKIYDDVSLFSRGVWIGKYPKALISNIYSISSNLQNTGSELAFMKWVLTDGQQFLNSNGYTDLLLTERQSAVDKFSNARIYSGTSSGKSPILIVALLIITILVLSGITLEAVSRFQKQRSVIVNTPTPVPTSILDENSLIIPAGLYFDKTHTWAFMEQNGMVKVGIDDFLQHITGAITRIKMKSQGDKVKKGEKILTIIQNGKQLNLYSPVSGIIKEQNESLDTDSSVINSSPYNEGWVYKIEPTNWLRENQLLFMADKQRQFIKSEFSRLKDFLAVALNGYSGKYAQIALQDGGELRDGILSDLGPEEWDDFQTKFIDPSRQVWFYELF
jgi:glycine cleavage system H lipoate-binding protein/ABC-type phosphate transport system substrate-binding protein